LATPEGSESCHMSFFIIPLCFTHTHHTPALLSLSMLCHFILPCAFVEPDVNFHRNFSPAPRCCRHRNRASLCGIACAPHVPFFEFIVCITSQEHVVIIILARALQRRGLDLHGRQLTSRLLACVVGYIVVRN
jgi:hypothetical protein